jgi:hypothetical protein
MQTLIEQIVAKLHQLPEPNVQEVLEFVEILSWYRCKTEALQAAEGRQSAQSASQSSKPDIDRDFNH